MSTKLKKWLRVTLISLPAVFVIALAGLHLYGRWSLSSYKKALIARGEQLTIDELRPHRVLSTENAAGPLGQACWQLQRLTTNNIQALAGFHLVEPGRGWVAWQQDPPIPEFERGWGRSGSGHPEMAWEALSELTTRAAPALDEVNLALQADYLDYSLDYRQGPALLLMHLAPLKSCAQFLTSATIVALHNGQLDQAIRHLHSLLRLAQLQAQEPLPISQMVRRATLLMAWHATWEALQAPGWTETELERLQRAWAELDLVHPFERAMEMDRAMNAAFLEQMRRSSDRARQLLQGQIGTAMAPPPSPNPAPQSADLGAWLSANTENLSNWGRDSALGGMITVWQWFLSYPMELHCLRSSQIVIDGLRALPKDRSISLSIDGARERFEHLPGANWFQRMIPIGPSADMYANIANGLARTEALRSMIVISLALRRYQIQSGAYPATLNSLVPKFLAAVPLDPADRKPMRYQVNVDGTYLLYSIGADGRDDHGDPRPMEKKNSPLQVTDGRDWTWPWPATHAEIESAISPK